MCVSPLRIKGKFFACGHCIECSVSKSNEWAHRIALELRDHRESCFLTLTYNNENLPKNGYLNKRDYQCFLKRLRIYLERSEDVKIRYFGCGEYGGKNSRPHYHLIIFGWKPKDLRYFFTSKDGDVLYRSDTLEKLWSKGFSTIGNVTFESAKYVAKYLQKTTKYFKDFPEDFIRPFLTMSKNPGIGFNQISPKMLETDKIYVNGKYVRLPRYFLDVLEKDGYDVKKWVKDKRDKNYRDIVLINYDGDITKYHDFLKRKRENYRKIFGKGIDNF